MPSGLCLPPDLVAKVKSALVSGKFDPEKLASMTSEQRHAIFKDVVGEGNAKFINSEFESKTLLKNQQRGYLTWAKKLVGVTPEVRRTLEAKVAKLDHILNPEEEKGFLKDLASTKLGIDVTVKEAKHIADLSQRVQEAEALPRSSTSAALEKGWKPTANDLKYGYARYDFHEHINNLKSDATGFKLSDLKGKSALQVVPIVSKAIVDTTKSLGASLDDSFALRQGMKSFWTNNRIWQKQFIQSFANIAKGIKNTEAAKRDITAHLMADPHYDQAIKDGLALKGNEDAFPTSLPEKIPIAGRAFGASEVAYNAFAENLRLAIYKKQLSLVKDLGSDTPKDYGKNMAKMVNSLTGRGTFGRYDTVAGPLNVAFYSARFLKSNIDTLLLHPLGSGVGGTTDFIRGKEGASLVSAAQKKAATNLAKIIVGTAGVIAVANQLKPGSADTDPRSSNFGKIKIGDTRFDYTGGMGSIIELATQLATKSTKSPTTGVVTKLNSGNYGSQTQVDVLTNFLEGKASPVGGVALDFGKGQDHNGNKPTIKSEAGNLVEPLGIKNYTELKSDPHAANILASVLADTFGIAANTYGKSNKTAQQNLSNTQQALQSKIGSQKFNAALKEFNTRYDNTLASQKGNIDKLPNSEKAGTITGIKDKIWTSIYKENDFKAPKAKRSSAGKSILNSIK